MGGGQVQVVGGSGGFRSVSRLGGSGPARGGSGPAGGSGQSADRGEGVRSVSQRGGVRSS